MSLLEDIYTLSPGTIIELFEVDATGILDTDGLPGSLYRFHSGTNELAGHGDVVWAGNTYTAFPVEADGFESNTRGTLPKPTVRIANISGLIGSLNRSFSDLVGAKLTRIRTLAKYLDAVNFVAGNSLEDPSQSFPNDVFYVNRKISENRIFVEYELASIFDLENIKLPRRQIIQNTCSWVYRSSECSYAGPDVADIYDRLVGSPTYTTDGCSKKLSGCKLRFPAVDGTEPVLPFGGFPGAGVF